MIELHGRFHIFSTFKYIKYGLIICIVPLIQALIKFNIQALFTAIKQEIFILLLITFISLVMWKCSSFTLTARELCTSQGVLFLRAKHFSRDSITAIELRRKFLLRPLGATQITLFFKNSYPVKKHSFYVTNKMALALADKLIPMREAPSHYQPSGWERISLVMLSTNIITTTAFVLYTINRISKLLGNSFKQAALTQLSEFEQLVATVLPAGVSAIFTVCLVFIFLSVLFSSFNTAGFSVTRNGGIIISRGGLLTKVERRIIAGCITYSDIRLTPTSRLLHRYPVYVAAGGFTANDMPLLVYKKGHESDIRQILPEFDLPKVLHTGKRCRSIKNFLWLPFIFLAILIVLIIVSIRNVPGLTAPLCLPLILTIGYTAFSVVAYFQEGFCQMKNRTLFLKQNRLLTMHMVSIYTHDLSFRATQTPLSATDGRCNLNVYLPDKRRFTVRAVSLYAVKELVFYM